MRVTDERLRVLADSSQATVKSLAAECLEARERGTMPAIDRVYNAFGQPNRLPIEMGDATYIESAEGAFSIVEWSPPGGRATQIHVVVDITAALGMDELPGNPQAVMRLRSGQAVDSIITLLAGYRASVWPQYKGVRVGR